MLREVVTPHNRPKILTCQLTTASGTGTAIIGSDDISSVSVASSQPTANLKRPFARTAIMGLTAGTGVGAGGFATIATVQSASTLVAAWNNAGGTSVDATGDILALGYDSSVTTLCMNQRVESTKIRPRCIWGKITGSTGAVAIGVGDFACTRTGTGAYTVNFKETFCRTPIILLTGIATGGTVRAPVIGTKTATSVTVTIANQAGTASDGDFYISVWGQTSRDEQGGRFRYLRNSQRRPRMLGARVTVAGPTLTVGSEDFTLVKNGTGDFTLTYLRPFRRECAVFGGSRSNRFQVISSSSTAININTLAAGAGSADPTSFDVIVIGSDDPSGY